MLWDLAQAFGIVVGIPVVVFMAGSNLFVRWSDWTSKSRRTDTV